MFYVPFSNSLFSIRTHVYIYFSRERLFIRIQNRNELATRPGSILAEGPKGLRRVSSRSGQLGGLGGKEAAGSKVSVASPQGPAALGFRKAGPEQEFSAQSEKGWRSIQPRGRLRIY